MSRSAPSAAATTSRSARPVSVLFAAFLGENPMSSLLGSTLKTLSPAHRAVITGPGFFSGLISGPFHHGLTIVFTFALVICLAAAAASWLRGGRAAIAPAPGVQDLTGTVPDLPRPSPQPARSRPAPAQAAGPGGQAAGPGGRRAARVATISASFGAGGTQVGPALAARLGLPFLDRAVPLQVAERLGVSPDAALARDEQVDGGLVRSLINLIGAPVSFGVSGVQTRPAADEEAFRRGTEKVLWELACGPGGVILGRAGAVVLASCPGAVHVRLDGPAAARADRAAREQGLDRAAAGDQLRQADRARTAYVRHLYGHDPRDPGLYHLVIDSTAVPLGTCVEAIAAVAADAGNAAGQPAQRPEGAAAPGAASSRPRGEGAQ